MIKRINTLFFSFKSSVKNKPMALVMLLIVIVVSVSACGFITRGILREMDYSLYGRIDFEFPEGMTILEKGNMMRELRANGLIDYDSDHLILTNINTEVNVNNKIYDDALEFQFVVFSQRYFDEKTIKDGMNYVILKNDTAEKFSCRVGDKIEILDTLYDIIDILDNNSGYYIGDIIMPYTSISDEINNFIIKSDFQNNGKYKFYGGALRMINDSDRAIMDKYGVTAENYKEKISSPIIMLSALLVLFTALAVGNLIFIIKYYEKVNAKKFAVYNIVGAKPRFIGASMFAEVMSVTIVGIGLGALADYLINLGVQAFEFKDRLLWAHYLISTGVIFITALIAITIMIIRRRKAQPIDRRYM